MELDSLAVRSAFVEASQFALAEVPAACMELTLEVLVELAVERDDGPDPVHLVRALTGRARLPDDLNVLG